MTTLSRTFGRAVAVLLVGLAILVGPQVETARAELQRDDIQTRQAQDSPLVYHFPAQYAPAIEKLQRRGPNTVAALSSGLGLDSFPTVDVWILPEVADYFRLTDRPGRAPEWAIGLSLGGEQTVIVARDTQLPGPATSDLEKTFVHELAHVAVDIARGEGRVPRWFNEGFALSHAREWTPQRRQQLVRAASTGALMSLADLDRNFPAHHNVASLAYAQSVHFVRYLEENHGEDVTARIMRSVRKGTPFDEAVEQATGRSMAALESTWRDRLTSQTSWLALLQDEFAIFFGAAVLFVILWFVRRNRLRRSPESAEESAGDWTYDKSRYPLPGEPRD